MEYILKLYKSRITEVKLSEESLFTLYQFSKNKYLSTYQVHRLLNNTRYKSEYKNVHKKVQNLLSLDLIEKLPRNLNNIQHGAIYYKLTSTGVFYLMLNSDSYLLEDIEIIKYFGSDQFFEFFIYPYFKNQTLCNLKLDRIIFYFQRHFTSIGKIIIELLKDLEDIDKNNGIFLIIGSWDLLSTNKKIEFKDEWEAFIFSLKRRLNLKWLDYDVKVKKIDNHTVTFEKDNEVIYLRFNESKTNLIISNNNKELYRFLVRKLNKSILIGELIKQTVEYEIKDRLKRFDKWIPEKVEELAVSLVKYSVPIKYSFNNEEIERIADIKTLSKDKNFIKIIKAVEKKYKEYFDNFLKEANDESKN